MNFGHVFFHFPNLLEFLSAYGTNKLFLICCRTLLMEMNMLDMRCDVIAVEEALSTNRAFIITFTSMLEGNINVKANFNN